MAKKRKSSAAAAAAAEPVEPTPEAPPENGATADDFKTLLERNQDGVLVVSEDKVVQYANSAGARLLKKKLPKLLGAAFEDELADGPMRSIDLNMKVEPVDWAGQPATLVVLKSLASTQSAFHVEWRIEAAEERAREFEERVKELEAAGGGSSEAPVVDESRIRDLEAELQSTLDRAQDAEQALARAEKRAEQAEAEVHQAEERARTAESRAKEAEALMEEAEAQAQEAERTLEDTGDSVRELEEKYEEALQRATSLEKELKLAQQGGTDAAELAAASLTEAEDRCRAAQAELLETKEKLQEVEDRLTEAQQSQEGASTELADLRTQLEEFQMRLLEAEEKVLESQGRAAEAADLLAAAEEQVTQAQQRADQAEGWAAEARTRLEESEARASELPSKDALEEAQEALREANERAQAAEKRADNAEHRLSELEGKELTELRELLEAAEAREAEALERLESAEEEGEARGELQKKLDAAEASVADLQGRLDEAENALAEAQEGSENAAAGAGKLLQNAERETAEAREALAQAVERAEVAEKGLAQAEQSLADAVGRAEAAEQSVTEAVQAAEKNVAEALARAEAAERDLEEARAEAEEAAGRVGLQDGLKALQESEEARATLEEQLAHALKDLAAAEERAAEAEAMLEEAEGVGGEPGEALKAAEERAEKLAQELKETQARLHQVADEADARVAQAMAAAGNGEAIVDPETERLAFQDLMTGLPNQNIIRRYLDYTLKQVERYDRTTALLCVDLDRFKVINDALGYKAGDEVLMQVAERLQSVVRDSDVLGRRGEDEFSILLSEVSGSPDPANQISIVAKRIFEVLAQPFVASGQKVYVGASIGISTSPGDANTAEEMLEHADTAMYRAKELGRGRYQFYTDELQARNESRLRLEAELRSALENKELILLYQPIVQISSGRMVGVEALLRWHHPEMGLVGPDHFLDAAEETGLIIPMGRWTILQACEQLADWSRKGLDLFVTLNLSTRQFLQADLASTLLRSVEIAGCPVQNIILEIPESIQTLDPSRVEPILLGLRQIGVRLAIDRFGTGFSSLERLHSELASFLKIDRKFIMNTPHNSQCVSIAAAAMGLARSLRLRPIAVGVENEAQLTFCRQMDCEMVQGNLIYTAVEPDLITDLARAGRVIR